MLMGSSPSPADPGQPSAPASASFAGRLWQVTKGVFSLIGAAASFIATVLGIYLFIVPPADEERILDQYADHALTYHSRTFPMEVTVDGVDAGNQDLVQTDLTFWRDGGKPIKADMTRRPLHVILPSGSHLVSFKVAQVDSSVPDNFTVERANDDLFVRWKVWDPDMALRIAIVRTGPVGSILLSTEVGPGVVVTGERYGTAKALGLLATMVVVTLTLMGLFLAGLFAFLNVFVTPVWAKRIPYAPIRVGFFLGFIAAFTAIAYQGVQYDARFVSWVSSRMVKPIPFSDAK
jgi:hypothetical protein